VYQFVYNTGSKTYEYAFNSVDELTIQLTPVLSFLGSFAMLHDDSNYRFYMLSH